MTMDAIKAEVEGLSPEDRKSLVAHLIALRHRELAGFRARMAQKIDDDNDGSWASLEDLDQRLQG